MPTLPDTEPPVSKGRCSLSRGLALNERKPKSRDVEAQLRHWFLANKQGHCFPVELRHSFIKPMMRSASDVTVQWGVRWTSTSRPRSQWGACVPLWSTPSPACLVHRPHSTLSYRRQHLYDLVWSPNIASWPTSSFHSPPPRYFHISSFGWHAPSVTMSL